MKNIIPIVFSFNYRVVMPAGVTFTSLLKSAKEDTFYDMYILHGEGELDKKYQDELTKLENHFSNCKFTFINIGYAFENVYIARGVPKLTYYRILIPELITHYDKVIFSDVDIIFTDDLFEVYSKTDLENTYLAAVRSGLTEEKYVKYIKSLGCNPLNYTSGGFQIYNLAAIRRDGMTAKLKALCGKKFVYLDQDVTNIVYNDKMTYISPRYNSTQTFFNNASSAPEKMNQFFTEKEIAEGIKPFVIHYNGVNPWQGMCQRHDQWWESYRNSIYYDQQFYFKHYQKLLNPTGNELLKQLPKALLKKNLGKLYRKLFPI